MCEGQLHVVRCVRKGLVVHGVSRPPELNNRIDLVSLPLAAYLDNERPCECFTRNFLLNIHVDLDAMDNLDEKKALLGTRDASKKQRYTLVIHGGAGTMAKERSTPEQRAQYKAALARALRAGHEVLHLGGEAMDAAVAAVSSMEGDYFTLMRYDNH